MSEAALELLTAILVSIFGIVNVLLSVIVSPIINERKENDKFIKEKLYDASVCLVSFVTDAVRIDEPQQELLTSFRNYCLQIHLLFRGGKAYTPIDRYMEDIYRFLYHANLKHISLSGGKRNIIRNLVRKMRFELAYYIENGVKKERKCQVSNLNISISTKCEKSLVIGELDSIEGIYFAEYEQGTFNIKYFREQISGKEIESDIEQIIKKYPKI